MRSTTLVCTAALLGAGAWAYRNLAGKLDWQRLVLIPWLNNVADKVGATKPASLPPYESDSRSGVQ